MRQLGTLPTQEQTRRLVDYLLTEGIHTRAEQDGEAWLIWVVDEDDFERSKAEFQRFQAAPDDTRFQGRESQAEELRAKQRERIVQARKNLNVIKGGSREKLGDRAKRIPITFGLTAICILVAVWTFLGAKRANIDVLTFVSARHYLDEGWRPDAFEDALIDIKQGQVWRLVSPAIIHFGPLHLIFNLLWLNQLGSQIESRKGWLKYVLLLLVLAAVSNLVQVYVSSFPASFGGMSGVVYGLLGYIWIKSQFDPKDKFYIHPSTLRLMLIWFAICFLPLPGLSIANGAHAGGLVLGMAIGYVSSQLR